MKTPNSFLNLSEKNTSSHMDNTADRIAALRELMRQRGWDAAIIAGSDPHSDEYVPERWQTRKWISGFTGSAGNIVITNGHAGLWTDGRYFIQAAKELEGSGIELHKTRIPGAIDIPEWLGLFCKDRPKARICFDGLTMSFQEVKAITESVSAHGGIMEDVPDFISGIWKDRPGYPDAPASIMPEKYAGRTRADKLSWLRGEMASKGCEAALLSVLDEIAWLLNLRGGDIDYNPLLLSYAIISANGCSLYTDKTKFSQTDIEKLRSDGIVLLPYDDIADGIAAASGIGGKIAIDSRTLNYHLYDKVLGHFGSERIADIPSPITLAKAVKNDAEIEGMKKAALMDGVAVTRLLIWLEEQMKLVKKGKATVSELDVADKLRSLREEAGAIDESFGTISAYGKNAALPHYSATEASFSYLKASGLYLVDSGGQYPYGTTDITRTIPLGRTSRKEKKAYTLVLKGMIALSMAVFPKGTRGTNLDILARNPLWQSRLDFGHGTGHGVGHRLCVHEGPQAIRHNWVDCPLLAGMVTSNEPGLYIEGGFGIRHENLVLCKEKGRNGFGDWLCFETITYAPISTAAINKSLLTKEELRWLNAYNKTVYVKLRHFLSAKERRWLEKYCRAI